MGPAALRLEGRRGNPEKIALALFAVFSNSVGLVVVGCFVVGG
jgi:hypothetical protein